MTYIKHMRMVTYGRQGGRGSGGSDENKLNNKKRNRRREARISYAQKALTIKGKTDKLYF